MLIKAALLLVIAAFAVLASVDVLLWLAIPGLPHLLARIGVWLLFAAFALLLGGGMVVLIVRIGAACAEYFSASQRMQRRIWFIQGQQNRLERLFYFKAKQINYINERKRKRLLIADNQRQIKALAAVVAQDLLVIKPKLSKTRFKQLQQEHTRYRKQLDVDALLELQQKIATIDGQT